MRLPPIIRNSGLANLCRKMIAGPNDSYHGSLSIDSYAREVSALDSRVHTIGIIFHTSMKALRWIIAVAHRFGMNQYIAHLSRRHAADPATSGNAAFHNRHTNQRCFILANGPSLSKQDLSPLAKEITIAVNTFWMHPAVADWQPTYYLFGDPWLWDPNSQTPEDIENYFCNITSRVPHTTFFLPARARQHIVDLKLLPVDQTNFIHLFPLPLYEMPPWESNLSNGFPWVQNVAQLAILLALSMGFTEIILLGCDHDWYVNRGPDKHFFEGSVWSGDNQYYDTSAEAYKQSAWFGWVLWRGHERLRSMAESRGVKIVNATGGGVLDVYPLASYEKMVGLAPASAQEKP